MMKKDYLSIFKNTSFQIVGKIITSASTILATIIMTRSLGVDGYGDFTKALSIIAIFYPIVDFGFNAVTLKYFTKNPNQTKEILEKLLVTRVLFSFAVIFLILLITIFLPYSPDTHLGFNSLVKLAIVVASFMVICQAVFVTFNSYFQYKLRYDQSAIASSLGSITSIIFILIFAYIYPSILTMVAANIIGSVAMVIISYFMIRRFLESINPKFDFDFSLKIFRNALPLGLTLIFNLIYFRADAIILSATRPTSEVAYYGLSYRVFENVLVIPIFFVNSIYPLMLKSIKNNIEKFKNFIKMSAIVLLASSIILSIIFYYSAEWIMLLIGGSDFLEAAAALKILSISIPAFYLSALTMWLLVVFNLQKILILIYGFGAVLNIILNLIFIPKFGYISASIITGVSESIILILSIIILVNYRYKLKHLDNLENYAT